MVTDHESADSTHFCSFVGCWTKVHMNAALVLDTRRCLHNFQLCGFPFFPLPTQGVSHGDPRCCGKRSNFSASPFLHPAVVGANESDTAKILATGAALCLPRGQRSFFCAHSPKCLYFPGLKLLPRPLLVLHTSYVLGRQDVYRIFRRTQTSVVHVVFFYYYFFLWPATVYWHIFQGLLRWRNYSNSHRCISGAPVCTGEFCIWLHRVSRKCARLAGRVSPETGESAGTRSQ